MLGAEFCRAALGVPAYFFCGSPPVQKAEGSDPIKKTFTNRGGDPFKS
jgi:hypothetical protein